MPLSETEAPSYSSTAVSLGLLILAVTASAAAFCFLDARHRGSVEHVDTPTAVGDTAYVKAPPGGAGPIGLKFQGRPLAVLGEAKIHDSKQIRAGTDDSGVYSLYRPEAGSAEAPPEGHYYLKLEPDRYLEAAPAEATPAQ